MTKYILLRKDKQCEGRIWNVLLDKNKSIHKPRHHSILITHKGPVDLYDAWQEMNFINEHQMTLGLLAP